MEPILQMQGSTVGLYLSDAHSGVRQLLDATGSTVQNLYRYDAFGNQLLFNPNTLNNIQYRGERFDPTLAQYYLRARYYNPAAGRFTAMDPFTGTLTSPATLNKYSYAANNPISYKDPTGKTFVDAFLSLSITLFNVGMKLTSIVTTIAYVSYNVALLALGALALEYAFYGATSPLTEYVFNYAAISFIASATTLMFLSAFFQNPFPPGEYKDANITRRLNLNPIRRDVGLARAGQIRRGINVGGTRTVAYADVETTNNPELEVIANSGESGRTGGQRDYITQWQATYPNSRYADALPIEEDIQQHAETHLLSYLRSVVSRFERGVIRIFIDCPSNPGGACQECADQLLSFRRDYPGITLEISAK